KPLSIDNQHELAALQDLAQQFDCILTSMETDWLLPGPTGESNRLSLHPVGKVLVIADELKTAIQFAIDALIAGCAVVLAAPGANAEALQSENLSYLPLQLLDGRVDVSQISQQLPFDAMALGVSDEDFLIYKSAVAVQFEHIFPVVRSLATPIRFATERHVCIDTTAAGGNATLLASAE
ncbi:MAG: bifunctional proline dehydrogenase/L-glutamate gamma-semialdehyde dehydrogenase, partial [Pseudomonadota bacterium]